MYIALNFKRVSHDLNSNFEHLIFAFGYIIGWALINDQTYSIFPSFDIYFDCEVINQI